MNTDASKAVGHQDQLGFSVMPKDTFTWTGETGDQTLELMDDLL